MSMSEFHDFLKKIKKIEIFYCRSYKTCVWLLKMVKHKKHEERMPENDKNNVTYYKKKKKDDEEVIGTRKEPTFRAPSSTK